MSDHEDPPGLSKKHRVLIVDDHPVVRDGLAQLLACQPDIEVCGGAESVADALQAVPVKQPDLVIIDISLKQSHGLDLVGRVKALNERVKMLVWSMHDDKVYAPRALQEGADGYVNKQEPTEVVIDAIRRVLSGEVYLSPEMSHYVLQQIGSASAKTGSIVSILSNRELEVFELIGKGLTTRMIARQLDVRPKTVEAHRENIKRKLHLKNSAELNRAAVLWVREDS